MAEGSVLRVVLAVILASSMLVADCSAETATPIAFILGDSTADVGTNNFLKDSKFKANIRFNGIDFPGGKATGRFSNGLNSADFLAKFLGLKISPPPFKSLNTNSSLLKQSFLGVNFASGGCGLLDLTGESPGQPNSTTKNVVTLSEQIQQFSVVRDTITSVVGPAGACKLLKKSLFFISIGSNDIFGYYYSPTKFSLYSLGARKFGIISVPPIGCCPSQRTEHGGCNGEQNDLAVAFHSSVTAMLKNLSTEHEGIIYSLGNAFDMTMDVILNPGITSKFFSSINFNVSDFTNMKAACCGTGRLRGQEMCNPKASLCSNRDQHLFWDMFHPTQAASYLAAQTLFGGGLRYVSPINFAQLAQA